MSGKIVAFLLVACAAVAGGALYWLQLYAFYEPVPAEAGAAELALVSISTGQSERFLLSDFEAVDSTSSPIRYRACFQTPMSLAMLTETYELYERAVPLVGPPGLPCFDATRIGEALETGEAIAFLSQRDITDGVDRVIAVFGDGKAYAWHQLNEKFTE
ncbi:MAG: DUF6446 family protein [Pseudomonadota bacterium]